jgi:hypothetical protein
LDISGIFFSSVYTVRAASGFNFQTFFPNASFLKRADLHGFGFILFTYELAYTTVLYEEY